MDVTLQPRLLRWARERAGLSVDALAKKMRVAAEKVMAWEEDGEIRFKDAERLARVTLTPFGYLFLGEPPDEPLPIPDFRTLQDRVIERPGPELLDTVYTMQRRQAWMRDFLIEEGAEPLPFVGSATLDDQPEAVAEAIRETLDLQPAWASSLQGWADALRHLRAKIEEAGILIFINGVVGNNTHRKLDPEEFRGFVLVDSYAPLIFINGRDAKSAQMFTFAHELAHLWLGISGVTNVDPSFPQLEAREPTERVCNNIAAELLVPQVLLRAEWPQASQQVEPYQTLARRFKVSEIVIARRAQELNLISKNEFFAFYQQYSEKQPAPSSKDGGSFWNTYRVRVDTRFGRAVVQAAREGRILYQEAYRLTGLKPNSFETFAEWLGY